MRKIFEIDGLEVMERGGKHFYQHQTSTSRRGWLESALTESQFEFLKDKKYTLRSHPKHSPTIELFIDDSTLDKSEWSMLYLLFQ